MRLLLVLTALAIAVAGCGDDEQPAGAAAAESSSIVSIESVDGTDVLADSGGRTLYTADVEKGDRILCVDACTSIWAPVLATAAEAESAAEDLDVDLALVERPDGDQQLTFDGLPLYTFTEEDAGRLEGDGFADDFEGTHFEWAAAATSGESEGSGGGGRGGYGY